MPDKEKSLWHPVSLEPVRPKFPVVFLTNSELSEHYRFQTIFEENWNTNFNGIENRHLQYPRFKQFRRLNQNFVEKYKDLVSKLDRQTVIILCIGTNEFKTTTKKSLEKSEKRCFKTIVQIVYFTRHTNHLLNIITSNPSYKFKAKQIKHQLDSELMLSRYWLVHRGRFTGARLQFSRPIPWFLERHGLRRDLFSEDRHHLSQKGLYLYITNVISKTIHFIQKYCIKYEPDEI